MLRSHPVNPGQVHLAIDRQRLKTLLAQGKLHADDFNCLDKQSKQTVWRLLLASAASRLNLS